MEGLNIQIRLKKLHKTQRWLLKQLQRKGFGTLREPRFSDILNGIYTTGCAPEVLAESDRILKEQES